MGVEGPEATDQLRLSLAGDLCVFKCWGGEKGKNTPDLEMCELRCVPGMLQI